MDAHLLDDPVLARFRDAVLRLYGPRVERIVLYGSRARGDAREDSDYDVAVFLRDVDDLWDEVERLADIRADILDAWDRLIHATPHRAGSLQERTPLMHDIRQDGIAL